MRYLVRLAIVAAISGAPAVAQNIRFGDDSSEWANDGECDDPRFQGAGMTTTPLLDQDILHDATDCRAAYNAGTITLSTGTVKDGKMQAVADLIIDGVNFGNDNGDWANDGECDDRRFSGVGRSALMTWDYIGSDAADCSSAYQSGQIYLWDSGAAAAATQCDAIDFGNDDGGYPADMECDDPRFEGPGASMAQSLDNIYGDATDCKRMCDYGVVFLRDYQ